MTLRSHSLLGGTGRVVRALSFALLPVLTMEGGQYDMFRHGPGAVPAPTSRKDTPPPKEDTASRPYLAVIAPPSLRFRDIPAPPPFDLEPTAGGPAYLEDQPQPAPRLTAQPAKDKVILTPEDLAREHGTPLPASSEKRVEKQDIPAILPDDLRREVRPEDLLPFFQFPRGSGMIETNVPVPPAPQQQPSSATYRQQ